MFEITKNLKKSGDYISSSIMDDIKNSAEFSIDDYKLYIKSLEECNLNWDNLIDPLLLLEGVLSNMFDYIKIIPLIKNVHSKKAQSDLIKISSFFESIRKNIYCNDEVISKFFDYYNGNYQKEKNKLGREENDIVENFNNIFLDSKKYVKFEFANIFDLISEEITSVILKHSGQFEIEENILPSLFDVNNDDGNDGNSNQENSQDHHEEIPVVQNNDNYEKNNNIASSNETIRSNKMNNNYDEIIVEIIENVAEEKTMKLNNITKTNIVSLYEVLKNENLVGYLFIKTDCDSSLCSNKIFNVTQKSKYSKEINLICSNINSNNEYIDDSILLFSNMLNECLNKMT